MAHDIVDFNCPECDHSHEVPVIRGEYPEEDYADIPDECESCGVSFLEIDPSGDDRRSERRQMGITF